MVDLRHLVKAFNDSESEEERRLLNFILELFRLGIPRALMNFVTSGGTCDVLSFASASAVCDTLNSIPGLSMLESRAAARRVVEQEDGSRLEKGKGVRADKGKGVGVDKGKEQGRQIVCCLPAVRREEGEVAKLAVERARKLPIAKGKRVAEEREKGGCKKNARLEACILISDAEVRRRNVALLDMFDLIPPSTPFH